MANLCYILKLSRHRLVQLAKHLYHDHRQTSCVLFCESDEFQVCLKSRIKTQFNQSVSSKNSSVGINNIHCRNFHVISAHLQSKGTRIDSVCIASSTFCQVFIDTRGESLKTEESGAPRGFGVRCSQQLVVLSSMRNEMSLRPCTGWRT